MSKKRNAYLLGLLVWLLWTVNVAAQTAVSPTILILPGDSWTALAIRFQVDESTLRQLNPHPNPQRQPAIGRTISLPETAVSHPGILVRPKSSLLTTAVRQQTSPWLLAIGNNRPSPYRSALYHPIFVPNNTAIPRDLPTGFATLELSQTVGAPGQAVGFRAETEKGLSFTAVLGDNEMDVFGNGRFAVGLTGTGAFFGTQQPSLTIEVADAPLW
ncbi:MAG: LysM peptidoglycan-binding domain-containing protein, partial [Chloroflexi bacterium]|nr:LysM peptidoglycan-binding domain-containing protein [Chloroflexota bacterium]